MPFSRCAPLVFRVIPNRRHPENEDLPPFWQRLQEYEVLPFEIDQCGNLYEDMKNIEIVPALPEHIDELGTAYYAAFKDFTDRHNAPMGSPDSVAYARKMVRHWLFPVGNPGI